MISLGAALNLLSTNGQRPYWQICESDEIRQLHNDALERQELWKRTSGGNQEFVLYDAWPARVWKDRFVAAVLAISHGPAAGLMGIVSEHPWDANGRCNGANLPDANNFGAANELGGGLVIGAIAGGADNDYTAIHWGGNYPTQSTKCPHHHGVWELDDITQVAALIGLVDSTRSTNTNAFALPDNGMFWYYDTDIDNNLYAVIRSNGVSQTNTSCGTIVGSTHYGTHIHIDNSCEIVDMIMGGTKIVDGADISGAPYANLRGAQLQPYFAVVNRAAAQLREMHAHDFYLIMHTGL